MRQPVLARKLISAGAAAVLIAGLAACSSNPSKSSSGGGVTLVVAGQSDNLTQSFNPYLPNTAQGLMFSPGGSPGFIYEPLVQVNTVDIGKDIPWLAKSWEWSNENKTFTVHLQTGVTWSDGKPFSSADVVFTYQMLQQYPALNAGGVPNATLNAPDANTVVFTFDQPSQQLFTNIVGAPIVSQHVWSTVGDPTKDRQ